MGKTYHRVLTIGGSDPSGGAGIQADLKTFSALGCYGLSVITALTAQNTLGVSAVYPVPPDLVEKQLDSLFTDVGAEAVKIGMIYSAEMIRVVAGMLKKHRARNIVLDPVMASQAGDSLLRDEAVEILKEDLIPMATVFTPNIPEAARILGIDASDASRWRSAADRLASYPTYETCLLYTSDAADE